MKFKIMFACLFGWTAAAQIECEGSLKNGATGSVLIFSDHVVVAGSQLTKPRIFNEIDRVNGLITAPGLAIAMRNNFGCITAVVTSEFRTPFGAGHMETIGPILCRGGETSDDVCGH